MTVLTLNRIRDIRNRVLPLPSGAAMEQLPSTFRQEGALMQQLIQIPEIQRKHKELLGKYPVPEDLVLALQNCFTILAAITSIQPLHSMILTSPAMAARVALEFGSGRMEMVPRDSDGVIHADCPTMFETFGMVMGTFGYEAFPGPYGESNMAQFLDGVAVGYSGHMHSMNEFRKLRTQVPRSIN